LEEVKEGEEKGTSFEGGELLAEGEVVDALHHGRGRSNLNRKHLNFNQQKLHKKYNLRQLLRNMRRIRGISDFSSSGEKEKR